MLRVVHLIRVIGICLASVFCCHCILCMYGNGFFVANAVPLEIYSESIHSAVPCQIYSEPVHRWIEHIILYGSLVHFWCLSNKFSLAEINEDTFFFSEVGHFSVL